MWVYIFVYRGALTSIWFTLRNCVYTIEMFVCGKYMYMYVYRGGLIRIDFDLVYNRFYLEDLRAHKCDVCVCVGGGRKGGS